MTCPAVILLARFISAWSMVAIIGLVVIASKMTFPLNYSHFIHVPQVRDPYSSSGRNRSLIFVATLWYVFNALLIYFEAERISESNWIV